MPFIYIVGGALTALLILYVLWAISPMLGGVFAGICFGYACLRY
jgi:hypothetical protein